MKFAALFLALAVPSRAELTAVVQTTRGNVQAALQFEKAPNAVANFITLAQGTRPHVNAATGAISTAPYYTGEKFFRVVNNTGFAIAQTGSGTATNVGGPGFTFKDEFDPALTHVPYVLSMANNGPNTNGSQIFFTGNTAIPSLDGVHTIFGLVTDPASRAVIDAIVTAGADATTVTGVTFSRTDPAAVAFDELARPLPAVSRPQGNLTVARNVAATWTLAEPQATGDIFRAFRSATLDAPWSELSAARRQNGLAAAGTTPFIGPVALDDASAPRNFYNLSFAKHPGSVTPVSLASRTVAMDLNGQRLSYAFNFAASGGIAAFYPDTKNDPTNYQTFSFLVLSIAPTAHAFSFVVLNQGDPIAGYYQFQVGCDAADDWLISGRHASNYLVLTPNGFVPTLVGRGNAAVTR